MSDIINFTEAVADYNKKISEALELKTITDVGTADSILVPSNKSSVANNASFTDTANVEGANKEVYTPITTEKSSTNTITDDYTDKADVAGAKLSTASTMLYNGRTTATGDVTLIDNASAMVDTTKTTGDKSSTISLETEEDEELVISTTEKSSTNTIADNYTDKADVAGAKLSTASTMLYNGRTTATGDVTLIDNASAMVDTTKTTGDKDSSISLEAVANEEAGIVAGEELEVELTDSKVFLANIDLLSIKEEIRLANAEIPVDGVITAEQIKRLTNAENALVDLIKSGITVTLKDDAKTRTYSTSLTEYRDKTGSKDSIYSYTPKALKDATVAWQAAKDVYEVTNRKPTAEELEVTKTAFNNLLALTSGKSDSQWDLKPTTIRKEQFTDEEVTQSSGGNGPAKIFQPIGGGLATTTNEDIFYDDDGTIASGMAEIAVARSSIASIDNNEVGYSVNVTDFTREENSLTSNALSFFLYNNIPYAVGKAAALVRSVANIAASTNSANWLQNAPNVAAGALSLYNDTKQYRYYTGKEMFKMLGQTFTTLMYVPYFKDFSVKIRKSGGVLPGAEIFEGGVSEDTINFGNENSKGLGEKLKDWLSEKLKISKGEGAKADDSFLFENFRDKAWVKIFEEKGKKNYDVSEFMDAVSKYGDNKEYRALIKELGFNNYDGTVTKDRNEARDAIVFDFTDEGLDEAWWNAGMKYAKGDTKFLSEIKDSLMSSKRYDNFSVGSMFVYPNGGLDAFQIPFQCNPIIGESGQEAKYEQTTMLHRTGGIMSYVGTGAQSLTIETEYTMMSSDEHLFDDYKDSPGNSWLDFWSVSMVKACERAFRSLVLPFTTTTDNEIVYKKPPVIKIALGPKNLNEGKETKTGLYDMLTFPMGDKYYHRTYIVTKVTVNKDMNESPVYWDTDNNLDTHTFKLTMELAEVDYNYIGATPAISDYYNTYSGSLALQ